MSRSKEYSKQHKATIRLVVVVSLVVIALVVFNVICLGRMSNTEVRDDMVQDAKVVSELAESGLEKLGELSIQGSAALSRSAVSDEMFEARRENVLRDFTRYNQFTQTYFLGNDSTLIMSNGQRIPFSGEKNAIIWNPSDQQGTFKIVSGISIGTEDLYFVSPVFKGDSIFGYFIGGCELKDRFAARVTACAELNGSLFIVNSTGLVIMQNGTVNDEALDGISNFFSFLKTELPDDGTYDSVIETIRENPGGYMQLYGDSRNYLMVFERLDSATEGYVIGILPASALSDAYISQRTEEIALLVIDIVFTVIIIAYLFIYGVKRSRSMVESLCYDALTHTLTTDYFRRRGAELMENTDFTYRVAVVDLVGFRYINELFGRERGDEVITVMARELGANLGKGELIGRNHADCFEMMIADYQLFRQKLIRVSEELRSFAQNIDVTYPILLRAGVVSCTKKNRDINDLIDKANAARKTADPQKGVYLVDYTDLMQGDIKMREEIEASMETAMEHGEFKVFLQPKMDVQKNCLAGAEALVRWIKRDGSMVYPDQFMPVFEENRFVEKLDFFMLDQVCALQKRLGEEGYERVPISVNQSQVLLSDPRYVTKVMDVINSYDLPRNLIELELTETTFFGDKDRMIEIMHQLREQNCIIDIDDFGSGYSSLNMIKDIPFDILKIDRMFFSDSNSGTGRVILQKIVEMAQAMNVDCICEGVETAEQEELLREIGCRYAQGYHYSKPIPADEFVEKFMKRNE
ncbi:MAG: EAL domain-containing protein [Lachnospiraceae bacterium]|nr:EAL domain-containing protein [Lachnospiraceae bacterium]